VKRAAAAILLCAAMAAAPACSRGSRQKKPLEPLRGDAVWLADGVSEEDAGIEERLARFRCAAVFFPARRMEYADGRWTGRDLPAPPRPLRNVPVVLVLGAPSDPIAPAPEERQSEFGKALAGEIAAAVARSAAFGDVRALHLDFPFSPATARAYQNAVAESRSSRRGLPVTVSLRFPRPDGKGEEALRSLASGTDGFVAFVFGGSAGADPAFTESLGKPWWAAYATATAAAVKKASGEPGPAVGEDALDALTDDPSTELLHELPWRAETGWDFSLRARQDLEAGGVELSAGDAVLFDRPSLPDLLRRLGSDTAGRRFARGRVVVFEGRSDAARLFPIAALEDVLLRRPLAPDVRAATQPEGGRLLRLEAENASPHASAVSRVENWLEIDLAPARVEDVLPGGFDRYEVYDERGRPVSPGRASRVRLYETFLAPFESLEPARIRVRGRLPSPCCPLRTHVFPAAGRELSTEWGFPTPGAPGNATPPPAPSVRGEGN